MGENVKEEIGHVVVPLMGSFKYKMGGRNLALVFANKTNRGLEETGDYINRQALVGDTSRQQSA